MTDLARPPNIVLILGDYMGYGDIGPTGAPDIKTPNLDRLAGEGTLFTDATAAAPICSPSRAALLTGRRPARIGLEENVNFGRTDIGLPASETTIASSLRNAGYATGLFGKWHLGASQWCDPMAHGFDEFLGFHDWSIDYHDHRMSNGKPGLYRQRESVTCEGYSTDLFSNEASSFIERHREQPFFVFLSYNAALPPHQPPGVGPRDLSNWNDGTREEYRAVIEAVDAGVGHVLQTLDNTGLADDTLVVFTYDHGGKELARAAPFFHGFATLWEGGLRVPLLMRWPGQIAPAQRRSDTVSLLDLAPTFADAAGVSLGAPNQLDPEQLAPQQLDGTSLYPLLSEGKALPERTLFWRIAFRSRRQKAARRGQWKFIWDAATEMLYDVGADPGERDDLIYSRPDIAHELRDALALWEQRYPADQRDWHG